MYTKNTLALRTVRIVNACVSIVVGLVGLLFTVVTHMQGHPLDFPNILCFFGVALNGHQTLTNVVKTFGGPSA